MEVLSARVASFKKTKRVKNPDKPSSSVTLKWPHPKDFRANPTTLAEAGFFYDPSYDDDDNATCYMCGKELGGWEDDDDPFTIHWTRCGQTCNWASVRCGLMSDVDQGGRFVSSDKTRVPTHKSMESARLGTFKAGDGWIHDKVKNHGASSKMMARAGFVYTPQQAGDDLATCLYCNVSLSGWDEDDDPLEEHRERSAKFDIPCAFFNASQPSKPASKAQSRPATSRSTSKSKHQDIMMPTKSYDGEDDNEPESSAAEPPTAIGKTPRKPSATGSNSRKSSAKTPKPSSRISSRSGLKNVAEEDIEEEEEIEPPATVKKKGRSASKSTTKASDLEAEPPATVKKKAARSRSKSVAREDPDEAVEVEAPATVKKKRTTSKSKAAPKSDLEAEEEVEAAPPATVKKKRAPSKTKAVPKTDIETDDDIPVEATVKKKTALRSKAPKSDQQMQIEIADEEPKPQKAKSRTTSKSKQVTPSDIDTDDEPPRKSSRSKTKETKSTTTKPNSRAKARAVAEVEADMFDSDVELDLEEPKTVKKATAPRTASKSKSKPEVQAQTPAPILEPDSEPDSELEYTSAAEPEPELPTSTATQKPIQKPRTASNSNINTKVLQMPHNIEATDLFNEDLVDQASTSTPSAISSPSPNPGAAQNIMADLPPLFVPKRNDASSSLKPPPKSTLATNPLIEMQMKKKKSLAPRKSSKPPNMATTATATLASSESSKTLPPSSSSSSTLGQMVAPKQPITDKAQPVNGSQLALKKMKVVEISSDDEDEVDEELEREREKQKEDARPQQPVVKKVPSPQEPPKPESKRSKKSVETEVAQPMSGTRPASPARAKPSSSALERQDDDVVMNVDEGKIDDNMDDIQAPDPSTPPRYKPHQTPPHEVAAASASSSSLGGAPPPIGAQDAAPTTTEPPVIPVLSRLPFTPLQSLSEAELDMTVEEWIRYQMEVEYDKFRRDGERELQRFRKQAEEVRKTIESL